MYTNRRDITMMAMMMALLIITAKISDFVTTIRLFISTNYNDLSDLSFIRNKIRAHCHIQLFDPRAHWITDFR